MIRNELLNSYIGIDLIGFVTVIGIVLAAYQLRTNEWKFRMSLYKKLINQALFFWTGMALIVLIFKYLALFFPFIILRYENLYALVINPLFIVVLDMIIFLFLIIGLIIFIHFSTTRHLDFNFIDKDKLKRFIFDEISYKSKNRFLNVVDLFIFNIDQIVVNSTEDNLYSILSWVIPSNEKFMDYVVVDSQEFIFSIYMGLECNPDLRYTDPIDNLVISIVHRSILNEDSILFDNDDIYAKEFLLGPRFLKHEIYSSIHDSQYAVFSDTLHFIRFLDIYKQMLKSVNNNTSGYLISLGEGIWKIMHVHLNNLVESSVSSTEKFFNDEYNSLYTVTKEIMDTIINHQDTIRALSDCDKINSLTSDLYVLVKEYAYKFHIQEYTTKYVYYLSKLKSTNKYSQEIFNKVNKRL